MKHVLIIVVSLFIFFVSVGLYRCFPGSVLPVMFGGMCLLCWLLFHLAYVSEERDLLKEGNQYFIDTFQDIRNPISLIKTPLGVACDGACPESIKKELTVAIHNIDGLEQHLVRLMELKHLFIHSRNLTVAEHEIGAFMKKKVYPLQSYAAGLRMNLELVPDFDYASAWFDQGKISPVIDKFILSAIECSLPKAHLVMTISLKGDFWAIKIKTAENEQFLRRCKCYASRLPISRVWYHGQHAIGGALFDKLLELCNGKILIQESEVLLRFPIKCPCMHGVEYGTKKVLETLIEDETGALFRNSCRKKDIDRPLVILADNDEKFRYYLEDRLAEYFIVKSFSDGEEALKAIREEYPDLVICDIMLHRMGGEELSSKLKTSRETSFIPVILLGSHIDLERREKRHLSLADVFICKPFNLEDLKIEIFVLINNSRVLRKSFLEKVFGDGFLAKKLDGSSRDINLDFLKEVRGYILENLDKEDLTIDDIASRMCMSRTTFYNKWKALTGEAPKYLISRIRMEKARELLESGKYSVTIVAEMVGLRNLKNFRGRYKEYFGRTPKEFIKRT